VTGDGAVSERWTCAGRRWRDSGHKLLTVWLDPAGEELHYATLTGNVGGLYDVTVNRAGEQVTVSASSLTYTGRSQDERVAV
jgi:hypothetical protein